MKISLIAAMTPDRVIGLNNTLPWHLPADLKHFKKLTQNKVVVMGHYTFNSIGKLLPDRTNVILTRRPLKVEGAKIMSSLEEVLRTFSLEKELMIIGGAQLFKQTLPIADRLYLTVIEVFLAGDVYFPEFNTNQWKEIFSERHEPDEKNHYAYRFTEWIKI